MVDNSDVFISMRGPLHQDQLDHMSIEWSKSRTMSLSSIYGPTLKISCCQRFFSWLWTCSKPLVCIWMISVEALIAYYVYWDYSTYFNICITFLCIPLGIASLYIMQIAYQSCRSHFDSDRITKFSGMNRNCLEILLMIPIINIFVILLPPPVILIKNRTHYTLERQSLLVLLLSVLTMIPQYILIICFILSHETNILLNWLQIGTCVITLSVFVLFHWSHIYALDSIGEQSIEKNALKFQLFWYKFQYYAEIFFYIYFVVIMLELMQCMPILFEYFYYGNIDKNTMFEMLIGFNVAKIICFSYYIYNISVYKKGTCCDCCCNIIPFIFFMITLTPLPLFPFMTITYKSLFEKRVLLLDQNKLNRDTMVQHGTNPTNTRTVSTNGYLRRTTTNGDGTTSDHESEDEDEDEDEMKRSELNESTPFHRTSTTSSVQEDLRRYHTMDSNTTNSKPNGHTINNQGAIINDSDGIHFEAYESMKSIKCQYLLLVVYLLLSYIGCNAWLVMNCGDIFCLGFKTQIMIYVTIGFVFLAIILYSPCVLKRMLNRSQLVLVGKEDIFDDWAWI